MCKLECAVRVTDDEFPDLFPAFVKEWTGAEVEFPFCGFGDSVAVGGGGGEKTELLTLLYKISKI